MIIVFNRVKGPHSESFLGGPEPGRGALGKVLCAGAVELDYGRFGRARLGVIPDAGAPRPVTAIRSLPVTAHRPGLSVPGRRAGAGAEPRTAR